MLKKQCKFCLIFLLLLFTKKTKASSDSLLISQLIKSIEAYQVKKFDGDFYEGMFYTYRECGAWPKNRKPDRNIFFTAITSFSLKNILPYLSDSNKIIAQSIIKKATKAYPYFRNKKANGFYEFWPNDGSFMPHSFVMQFTKKIFGQGEDADDCVMILMTSNNSDSVYQLLKKRMEYVANLNQKKIKNSYKIYSNFPAYSTYLGSKMKVDFDCCVQSNIMYYCFNQKFALTKQDSGTIKLLAEIVRNRDYLNHPTFVSPWYGNPSVILYHIIRLMNAFYIPELNLYKQQLIEDVQFLLKQSSNSMDKILLSTSLLRLGVKDGGKINFEDLKSFENSDQKEFHFFQARGAAFMSKIFKKIFSNQGKSFYFNFFCPTHNKILLLEYLVERNKIAY